jgi:hypothetical protein
MAVTDLHLKLLIDADGRASVVQIGNVAKAVAGLEAKALTARAPLAGLGDKSPGRTMTPPSRPWPISGPSASPRRNSPSSPR